MRALVSFPIGYPQEKQEQEVQKVKKFLENARQKLKEKDLDFTYSVGNPQRIGLGLFEVPIIMAPLDVFPTVAEHLFKTSRLLTSPLWIRLSGRAPLSKEAPSTFGIAWAEIFMTSHGKLILGVVRYTEDDVDFIYGSMGYKAGFVEEIRNSKLTKDLESSLVSSFEKFAGVLLEAQGVHASRIRLFWDNSGRALQTNLKFEVWKNHAFEMIIPINLQLKLDVEEFIEQVKGFHCTPSMDVHLSPL